jgi:hypothetical protein
MPKKLVELIYKHAHECSANEEVFSVRPIVNGTIYFKQVPVCMETNIELELVDKRYS